MSNNETPPPIDITDYDNKVPDYYTPDMDVSVDVSPTNNTSESPVRENNAKALEDDAQENQEIQETHESQEIHEIQLASDSQVNQIVQVNQENISVSEEQILPHNFEAEKSLLGTILLNNLAHEKVSEYLKPEHFSDALHACIYKEATTLINKSHVADVISVSQYLHDNELFKEAGGKEFLLTLLDYPVSVYNANDYGKMIYDLHLRRNLINIGKNIVYDAHHVSSEIMATTLIEDTESKLFDLAITGDTSKSFVDFETSVREALEVAAIAHKRDGNLAGVDTGLDELNKLLGGLHKSDLLILAGRPSMGKTALATNIAFNAAKQYHDTNGEHGAAVAFFSLEMSASQLASRILSAESEVKSDHMRKGILEEKDLEKLVSTVDLIYNSPLFIDDTAGITVASIRTRARRLKRQHNIGLIVIDYLQLITGSAKYAGNRVNEVSEITRGLKILAKELEIPVVALSQLSRSLESRDDKRPQLSDLRESGSIEQDADVVMFVYRDEYYLSRSEPQPGGNMSPEKYQERYQRWLERLENAQDKAEIIIQKQRHGPLGTAVVKFVSQHAQFKNLDFHEQTNYTFDE